jgi:hypothetical protein
VAEPVEPTSIRRNVKIQSNDFRVHPGKEFKLGDRPTVIKPFCKSKKQYRKT